MTSHSKTDVAPPVAVIGGGVAGLATAIALRQRGIECRVFERSAGGGAHGLAIILMPNGLKALDALGLGARVRALGGKARRAVVCSAAGRLIHERELSEHVCVMRRDLVDLLTRALPDGVLRAGMEFTGFEADVRGSPRAARFACGALVTAVGFIGADGVRSRVRKCQYPTHAMVAPRVKELISLARLPDVVALLGNNLRKFVSEAGGLAVGIASPGRGQVLWYLQYDSKRWDVATLSPRRLAEFARTLVGGWPEPIPRLLRETDYAQSHVCAVPSMAPLASSIRGNVALVGDAAHPFPTLTSQGANTALEDAVCLARCRRLVPWRERLAAYDTARRRVLRERYHEGSLRIGEFLRPAPASAERA